MYTIKINFFHFIFCSLFILEMKPNNVFQQFCAWKTRKKQFSSFYNSNKQNFNFLVFAQNHNNRCIRWNSEVKIVQWNSGAHTLNKFSYNDFNFIAFIFLYCKRKKNHFLIIWLSTAFVFLNLWNIIPTKPKPKFSIFNYSVFQLWLQTSVEIQYVDWNIHFFV